MQLRPDARAILFYIVEQLDSSQDKANFFLTYKQVHTALKLAMKGDTFGRSLDVQGLGQLADWAHANHLPAVTGLIISQDDRQPGAKFYSQNKRKPDDLDFWIEAVKRSREFDWKPYLGLASASSATAPATATPARVEPRPEQAPRPIAGAEPQTPRTYLLVWNPESYKWKSLRGC